MRGRRGVLNSIFGGRGTASHYHEFHQLSRSFGGFPSASRRFWGILKLSNSHEWLVNKDTECGQKTQDSRLKTEEVKTIRKTKDSSKVYKKLTTFQTLESLSFFSFSEPQRLKTQDSRVQKNVNVNDTRGTALEAHGQEASRSPSSSWRLVSGCVVRPPPVGHGERARCCIHSSPDNAHSSSSTTTNTAAARRAVAAERHRAPGADAAGRV